ncbi:MAG: PKD domain-containing protein [Acidobacteria bacterium]|nr:PKD domain-containing protein [Acidobacteriota bacterium]
MPNIGQRAVRFLSCSPRWIAMAVAVVLATGSATAASRELFSSDGASLAPFPCHYLSWAPAPGVDSTDGLPAPSITYGTYSPASYGLSEPFPVGAFGFGTMLRGSLDFKMEGPGNWASVAAFGMSTSSPCDYHPYNGPHDGRYPVPQVDYWSPAGLLSIWYMDQPGHTANLQVSFAISVGSWHHTDFLFKPALDGSYDWELRIDGQLAAQGRSYEPIRQDETLGVMIGATGSFEPSIVKYDNIRVEVVEAVSAGFSWSPARPNPGEPVQLTDSSTGGPTAWSWDFGDGGSSIEQSPAHAFAAPGTYAVTLTAANDAGSSSVSKPIRVNAPPVADAGPDQTVACGPTCFAGVTLNGSGSSDSDGDPLSFTWAGALVSAGGASPTIGLPTGQHAISLSVADSFGGFATDEVTITVADQASPGILSVSSCPDVLWPPNHELIPVTVGVSAFDSCGGPPECRVTSVISSEPESGLGGGDEQPDWQILGDLIVALRAERAGNGSGRTYAILVECRDGAGNATTSTTSVTVPHNH